MLRSIFLLSIAVSLLGCEDDDAGSGGIGASAGDGAGGAGGAGPDIPPAPAITWETCSPAETPGFECADVPVPLDWSAPDGPSMTVRIRRKPAAVDPPRGSAFLLEGGPGAPATWMLPWASDLAGRHPDLDVVVIEHRGTGASGALECEAPSDPPPASCLQALLAERPEAVNAATANASARDVAAIVRWFARGETQVLYGRSYGTYWAHRAVSLDPGAFDALILDSPCDAVAGCPAPHRDRQVDEVARAFLARCDADAACAARLPGGAVAFAEQVVANADAGACAAAADAGISGARLRVAANRLTSSEEARSLVPALFYRYDRCNADDALVWPHLAEWLTLTEDLLSASPDFSLPTNYHVMRSEFWGAGIGVADAQAQLTDTIAASGASVRWAEAFATWPWPAIPADASLHAWHLEATPTLVLVADLDMSTPAGLVAPLEATLAPGSSWVRLGFAGHVASAGEGTYAACARSLIDAYLDTPGTALDTTCVGAADGQSLTALFTPSETASSTWFGTPSAYGD